MAQRGLMECFPTTPCFLLPGRCDPNRAGSSRFRLVYGQILLNPPKRIPPIAEPKPQASNPRLQSTLALTAHRQTKRVCRKRKPAFF